MRIISFDVGMKNLAFCIFTIPDDKQSYPALPKSLSGVTHQHMLDILQHIKIERWDVIDLRNEPAPISCNITGSTHTHIYTPAPQPPVLPHKTCDNDSKHAKYMYLPPKNASLSSLSDSLESNNNIKLYCAKCSEKSKYKVPTREIMPLKRNPILLQKKKLDELIDIYNEVNSGSVPGPSGPSGPPDHQNKKIKKSDRIQEIETILSRDYMETYDINKYTKYTAVPIVIEDTDTVTAPPQNQYAAHDIDLITYGRNLMKHMDVILTTLWPIDMMIIENQISTIATRMKTLQGMITQYFIMKKVPQIEFISASCKLKLITDSMVDISSYGDRKKAGIAICRSLGVNQTTEYSKWMPLFEQHKKKDDLADCFLQGLWRVYLLMGGSSK